MSLSKFSEVIVIIITAVIILHIITILIIIIISRTVITAAHGQDVIDGVCYILLYLDEFNYFCIAVATGPWHGTSALPRETQMLRMTRALPAVSHSGLRDYKGCRV